MPNSKNIRILCFTCALAIAAGLVQTPAPASTTLAARTPLEYRTWKFEHKAGGEQTLSQTYIPLIATLNFGKQTDVVVSASAGISEVDRNVQETGSLTGASDIKVQGFHRILRGRVLLLGGVNLPAGKRNLSEEELAVSRALSHPLLGMRLKHYGRGFDVNVGGALSLPISKQWKAGLAAGFLYPGEYTLRSGDEKYKPTPQASLAAGLELRSTGLKSQRHSAGVRATYRTFGEDELGGKKIFEEGDQVEVILRGRTHFGNFHPLLFSQAIFKQDNTSFDSAGDDVSALKETPGQGLVTQLNFLYGFTNRVQAGVIGAWTHFSGADDVTRNGDTYGFGPSFAFGVAKGSWIRVNGQYLAGTAGEGELESDLSGFSVSGSLVWRP